MPRLFKFLKAALLFILISLFSLPALAAEGDILLFDDFSDGNLDGWTIQSGNWYINNGNLVGSKSGRAFGGRISNGSSQWDNYRIELDFNAQSGIDHGVGFRYTPDGDSYEINFRHGTGLYNTPEIILRKNQSGIVTTLFDTHSYPLINQKWYQLKVELKDENIKAWIGDTLIFDITDSETLVKKGVLTLSYWTGDISNIYVRFDNIKLTALAPPPSLKTPLILIPGIGGSELKVEEDTIWNATDGHGGTFNHIYPSGEKVWVNEDEAANPGNDDYFDVLRMRDDGITSEAHIGLTNNLLARAYQGAIDFFTANGYILNEDLFVFPYDWRKDISTTKTELDNKINQIKSQTGSTKVDIVAHSMGGLVARNYIADVNRAQNVRKLFTLGTPHLGATEFLKVLRYGGCLKYPFGPYCLSLAPSEMNDVIQNMISGFQLAPSQSYFNFYSNEDAQHPYPYRTENGALNYNQIKNLLTIVGHNTALFNPSETFHSIDSTLSTTNGVDVVVIAGSGQPTLGQIIEIKDTSLFGIAGIHKDMRIINGDETVPLLSASFGSQQTLYTNQKHGNLVTNGPALNLVKNILDSNNQLPGGVSTQPFKLAGNTLSVHSPVDIHVYDSSGNHTGPTTDGFETNIPGSSYDTLGDAKFIYLPINGVYDVKFEATNQGSFDFKIRKFENDENSKTILYKEIPLTENTKAETTFDTNSDQSPVIKLDEDGNGTIDANVEKFSILEGNANYDYTPPTISLDVSPKSIWPPNNKMVDVNITGTIADDNPYLTKIIVEDEYDLIESSVTLGSQTNINQAIKLEASRKGDDKDGRKYIIKIFATDLAGNTSLSSFEVIVPHDQRNKR